MQTHQPAQRYKATIAYDGTDFLGFQIQAGGRTVQSELQRALTKIAKHPVKIIGAGRTDTGVHATGQVIAFNLNWNHSPQKLQKAFNANLPSDIIIGDLTTVNSTFHPRFSARSRQYTYTILNQPLSNVLRQRYATHIARPLNVDLMQQAGQSLIGTHNFASFGRPPQGSNTVRTIIDLSWQVQKTELIFSITANAFLYRMVRNIVGTLLQVGMGVISVDSVKHILLAQDRARAGAPAAPNGLCLVNVSYDD